MDWKHERPTDPTGPQGKDLHYQQGLMMAEIQELKGRVMILEGQVLRLLRPKHSIRPQVQTAGLGAVAAGVVAGIFEILRLVGVFH